MIVMTVMIFTTVSPVFGICPVTLSLSTYPAQSVALQKLLPTPIVDDEGQW